MNWWNNSKCEKIENCVRIPPAYSFLSISAKPWTRKSTWFNCGFGFCLVLFGKLVKKWPHFVLFGFVLLTHQSQCNKTNTLCCTNGWMKHCNAEETFAIGKPLKTELTVKNFICKLRHLICNILLLQNCFQCFSLNQCCLKKYGVAN